MTGADIAALVEAFKSLPALYIADGHHRAASAARARAELRAKGGRTTDADRFVAVAFPDNQAQILAYNRTVKDLAGETPESLIGAIRASEIVVTHGTPVPELPARRQELIAEVIANCWIAFVRLLDRGLEDVIYSTPLAQYTVRHRRSMRRDAPARGQKLVSCSPTPASRLFSVTARKHTTTDRSRGITS